MSRPQNPSLFSGVVFFENRDSDPHPPRDQPTPGPHPSAEGTPSHKKTASCRSIIGLGWRKGLSPFGGHLTGLALDDRLAVVLDHEQREAAPSSEISMISSAEWAYRTSHTRAHRSERSGISGKYPDKGQWAGSVTWPQLRCRVTQRCWPFCGVQALEYPRMRHYKRSMVEAVPPSICALT